MRRRFEQRGAAIRRTVRAIVAVVSIATMSLAAAPLSGAEDDVGPNTERDAAVMAVLDEYMDGLNDLDMERHVSTYRFPHYRHASGKIVVWQTPEEAMPILKAPPAERRAAARRVLDKDWHRSVWTQRDIVQGDSRKVHVATQFVRLREDGSEIATYDSLYVLTYEDGRWAIKGRSSFAP